MAQIKTVFPEAYTFRQEKNVPLFNSSFKKGSFQLTVEPSFTSGWHPSLLIHYIPPGPSLYTTPDLKSVCVCVSHPCCPPDQKESRPHFSASRLLERRQTFSLNLVSIVKHHHAVSTCNTLLLWCNVNNIVCIYGCVCVYTHSLSLISQCVVWKLRIIFLTVT